MTYLELINKVLRGLREKQVTSFSSEYVNLIGQLVNEAKEEVEDAWPWKALRTDVTFNTVSGTQDYNLGTGGVGTGGTTTERSKLVMDSAQRPMLFVTTSGYETRCIEMPREQHKEWIIDNELSNTNPVYFSQVRSATGITISLYPKPNGVYAMRGTFYIPQAELSTLTTSITCPSKPVWLRALALALEERNAGSAGSTDYRAQQALWNAITSEAEDGELTLYEA